MSMLLEETVARRTSLPAERLRTSMAAARVSIRWFGARKTLTSEQKSQAAESFGAEGAFLSAGKKLLDTGHPAFRAATSVRHRIVSYWKGVSLPYPEPGVRLIRQRDLAAFDVQLTTLRAELADAVARLEEHYAELKAAARQRLGRLFSSADYPDSLAGLFQVEWDFPSVEPPDYLRQLNPELFRQEQARVAARFDEAVRLAEEAFTAELAKLVAHLRERITGQEDGKPKVFRDSAVENLKEFFDRFRLLNIRSDEQLDALVAQANDVIRGVEPQELRDSAGLRQRVAAELSGVQSLLDELLVERPRRKILRRSVP